MLKPCPCGKTPERLYLGRVNGSRIMLVVPDCCENWSASFRTAMKTIFSKYAEKKAIEVWNSAPRVEIIGEVEK